MSGGTRAAEHIPEGYQAAADALAGKIILVTGASDGIGRAASLCFASHGATVVMVARSVDKLESVYDAIENAGGPQPAAIPFDLASSMEEDFVALANSVGEEFGRLDGLLLNAGTLGQRRPMDQYRWDDWQQVMHLNVNSQFLTAKAMMPLLNEAPSASLLFTSSGVGRRGSAFWGAYAVSKFATEGMMQVFANETENTGAVRVNSINPGATNTAMRRAAYPAEHPDSNPAPGDIMRTYLYLMDDASGNCSGISFDAQ